MQQNDDKSKPYFVKETEWKKRYELLLKQYQAEIKKNDICKKISEDLYDLSCLVCKTAENPTLKKAIILEQFCKSPLKTIKRIYMRIVHKIPFENHPLIHLEDQIYKIHSSVEALLAGNIAGDTKETVISRLQNESYRGIWIIGSLDMGWHEKFKQRHHHLAENLMKNGYLVFCAMNPAFPDDKTNYIRQIRDRLYLLNLNDPVKRKEILSLLILNSRKKVYYSLMPTEPGTTIEELLFLQKMGVTIYYDYFDELSKDIYPGITPQHIERHEFLINNPDVLICATSENLYKKAAVCNKNRVILSRNGVCLEDWYVPEETPPPDEMKEVLARGGKIIGFYGSFAPWLDYTMLRTLAEKRPDYNLVMIGYDYEWGHGAFAASRIFELPNVFIIPEQKYDNLKYFSRYFDVGIIPFRIYELTISVSPVKMFEYMAQGIPVVTSSMPECKRYKSCLIAEDPESFVAQVDYALTLHDNSEYQHILQKEAGENTWENISERILDFIETNAVLPLKANSKPLLTIAVPAYNMEKYLPDLMERLTYPMLMPYLEVILVNDGSIDGTLALCRHYANQYPNMVHVVDKENGGHGSCINAGIKHASGRYFKLVDADDYLDPDSLLQHLYCLSKSQADMVICNYHQFFTNGHIVPIAYTDRLKENLCYSTAELVDALHRDDTLTSYIHMHAITYRTDLLKNNQIRITEHSFFVDQEYITYPFRFVKTAEYQNIDLYCYRMGRPGQSVDPATITRKMGMHYNILQKLRARYGEKETQNDPVQEKYLLMILYHHTFYFLEHTDDESLFDEVMAWWRDPAFAATRKTYYKSLCRYFSSSFSGRKRVACIRNFIKRLPGYSTIRRCVK